MCCHAASLWLDSYILVRLPACFTPTCITEMRGTSENNITEIPYSMRVGRFKFALILCITLCTPGMFTFSIAAS